MEIDNFLIALATIGCAFAYIIYWLWFLPMNRVRRWYEVGYNHLVDGKKVFLKRHLQCITIK